MADETRSEYKLVTEKKEEMKPVFDRMDTDEKLYFLEPYKMKMLPPYQSKDMPDVANITTNDPLLYGTKSIGIMAGATMQTIVEGRKMKDPQTTLIEQFLEDIYYMVDEWLPKRKYPGMDAFINEQICIRGRISARSCIKIEESKGLLPDIVPLDTRNYADETDGNDLIWAAPTFRRSKALIERQYQKEGDRFDKISLGNKYPEVVDFWNDEINVVFVDKQIIREQENPYGYVPFVSIICPVGSFLNTKDAEEHEGESIFWSNRGLWPEKNRLTTILQTISVDALFGALQYESTHGENMPKPSKSPYSPRTVHGIEKGGGYKPMPLNDIKNATRLVYAIVEACLQKGSLAAIDYGTLAFPLAAVAITRLSASRDDIFIPRIQAKAMFYQALSRMIIKQCIGLKEKLELGREGSRNEYTAKDLGGDYTIQYHFFTDTKEQRIANLAIAHNSRGILSDDTIRRDVMNLKDPDGEGVKVKAEEAERADEVLFLFRRGISLLTPQGDEKPSEEAQIEARILKDRIVTILKQRRALGTLSPIEKQKGDEVQPGKGTIPLLGEGGGGQRGTPEPEEPEESAETAKEAANA